MERAPASTTANVASAPSGANVSTPKAARVKARLSSLGDPRVRRAATAALGACAADAAARPLHWVYNMDDMNRYYVTEGGTHSSCDGGSASALGT